MRSILALYITLMPVSAKTQRTVSLPVTLAHALEDLSE